MLKHPSLVWALVVVQTLCGLYFLWEILASVFGLPDLPVRWQWREAIEVAAVLGLIFGAVLGVWLALQARREISRATSARRLTAGDFSAEVATRFTEMDLSPAETEVAWFLLKGMSLVEIAELRGTREGTVRAQSTALYRKAGVSGKTQFLALIVEDLLL
ncbi:MAG TPA: helix-turn-helix transcriptional regulator [Aliiroseovarius sp.]|nr:helix-turn-helix transcriptional regulator [Aliiroseovarius sp.]